MLGRDVSRLPSPNSLLVGGLTNVLLEGTGQSN